MWQAEQVASTTLKQLELWLPGGVFFPSRIPSGPRHSTTSLSPIYHHLCSSTLKTLLSVYSSSTFRTSSDDRTSTLSSIRSPNRSTPLTALISKKKRTRTLMRVIAWLKQPSELVVNFLLQQICKKVI